MGRHCRFGPVAATAGPGPARAVGAGRIAERCALQGSSRLRSGPTRTHRLDTHLFEADPLIEGLTVSSLLTADGLSLG